MGGTSAFDGAENRRIASFEVIGSGRTARLPDQNLRLPKPRARGEGALSSEPNRRSRSGLAGPQPIKFRAREPIPR